MAKYSIESELFLGMSHSGAVTTCGENSVELSDEEVNILIDLIRVKKSTDVDELNIEESHPDLYEKLREAYYNLAYDAEETHWLWEGYKNGYFEYDKKELMNYCKSNCGFSFEYSKDDYTDAVLDAFKKWLDDYLNGLSDKEVKDFFYNHMNAGLELDDIEYSVEIPEAIIRKAKGTDA